MAKKQNEIDASDKQPIEQLQERYEDLNKRKIQAETQRESAESRLKELQEEALKKYGTADIAELKTKLEEIKEENEEKRAKYQADLDKIDEKLREVEERFAPQTDTDDEEQE